MKSLYSLLGLSLASLLFFTSCNRKQENTNTNIQSYKLGELNHQFSISPAALDNFNKGLLLLHSFEYDDAKEAFLAAQNDDKEEMMAYWGEVMCNYKALWGLQDVPAGREVLTKLGSSREERVGKTDDELKRGFWEGVEILFGEGEFFERNTKYAQHMKGLYDKYPGNHEVAAFYSLGLMWSANGESLQQTLNKSAEVAASIIEENPTHPGALHYMIHSNDDPDYAKLAKNAADEYAKVAPDAAHALHMPSHIYVALGMWNDVVNSNVDSYAASIHRMENKGLSGKARGYHSMAWLHYGYLQQGRYDKAEELLKEMVSYYENSTHSDRYLIVMQNEQRIESGEWPTNIQPINVYYYDLGLSDKSGLHFFRSLLAYDRGDAQSIDYEIDTLSTHLESAKLEVTDEGVALCSAGPTNYAPNKMDIERTKVVLHQMEALKAMINNDDELAEKHMVEATELEAITTYDSGPPFIAYPSFEQYGDWLLTKNRAEEALVQFDKSLVNRTNRSKSLRGKIKALTILNRMKEVEEVQKILEVFWKKELTAMN